MSVPEGIEEALNDGACHHYGLQQLKHTYHHELVQVRQHGQGSDRLISRTVHDEAVDLVSYVLIRHGHQLEGGAIGTDVAPLKRLIHAPVEVNASLSCIAGVEEGREGLLHLGERDDESACDAVSS